MNIYQSIPDQYTWSTSNHSDTKRNVEQPLQYLQPWRAHANPFLVTVRQIVYTRIDAFFNSMTLGNGNDRWSIAYSLHQEIRVLLQAVVPHSRVPQLLPY